MEEDGHERHQCHAGRENQLIVLEDQRLRTRQDRWVRDAGGDAGRDDDRSADHGLPIAHAARETNGDLLEVTMGRTRGRAGFVSTRQKALFGKRPDKFLDVGSGGVLLFVRGARFAHRSTVGKPAQQRGRIRWNGEEAIARGVPNDDIVAIRLRDKRRNCDARVGGQHESTEMKDSVGGRSEATTVSTVESG